MIRIAVLLVLAATVGCVPQRRPKPRPEPQPNPRPTPAVIADFSGVTAVMKAGDRTLAPKVRQSWAAFAWVIGRADLETTGELREVIAVFERLCFTNTELAGKFPGFSAAANAALTTALGDDDRPLDPGEAEGVLRQLAEACK
jgi:hypothetical protein